MPRRIRLDLPGVPVHVTDRGDEGRNLFVTEEDRAFVVQRAAEVFADAKVSCLAFAIMTNHWHFLLVPGEEPLARPMLRLKTSVARRYRSVHGERGGVFQGRYHTNCLARRRRDGRDDEAALPEVLLYVLLNPAKARIVRSVEELATWPWTSLPDFLGLRSPVLTDVPRALGLLGGDDVPTRRWLVDVLAARIDGGEFDPEAAGAVIPRRAAQDAGMREGQREATGTAAIGALAEVSSAASTAASTRELTPRSASPAGASAHGRRLCRAALEALGWTTAHLVRAACAVFGADEASVRLGGRAPPECSARAVAIATGCDALAATVSEMARATGIGVSSAVAARLRGRRLMDELGLDPRTLIRAPGGDAGGPPPQG